MEDLSLDTSPHRQNSTLSLVSGGGKACTRMYTHTAEAVQCAIVTGASRSTTPAHTSEYTISNTWRGGYGLAKNRTWEQTRDSLPGYPHKMANRSSHSGPENIQSFTNLSGRSHPNLWNS